MSAAHCPYVSRAGLKLAAALRSFSLDVRGWVCCDFGSQVGGFVDCLLQQGAARVYAVDPGYGVLDYGLRRDPRVVVCERTNALSFVCPEPCELVTIDVGWTPQRLILPAARRCLKPQIGRVITLIKPQYEATAADVVPAGQARRKSLKRGVLPAERLEQVLAMCRSDIGGLGWQILAELKSPLPGHGGNLEHIFLLRPT